MGLHKIMFGKRFIHPQKVINHFYTIMFFTKEYKIPSYWVRPFPVLKLQLCCLISKCNSLNNVSHSRSHFEYIKIHSYYLEDMDTSLHFFFDSLVCCFHEEKFSWWPLSGKFCPWGHLATFKSPSCPRRW